MKEEKVKRKRTVRVKTVKYRQRKGLERLAQLCEQFPSTTYIITSAG